MDGIKTKWWMNSKESWLSTCKPKSQQRHSFFHHRQTNSLAAPSPSIMLLDVLLTTSNYTYSKMDPPAPTPHDNDSFVKAAGTITHPLSMTSDTISHHHRHNLIMSTIFRFHKKRALKISQFNSKMKHEYGSWLVILGARTDRRLLSKTYSKMRARIFQDGFCDAGQLPITKSKKKNTHVYTRHSDKEGE